MFILFMIIFVSQCMYISPEVCFMHVYVIHKSHQNIMSLPNNPDIVFCEYLSPNYI